MTFVEILWPINVSSADARSTLGTYNNAHADSLSTFDVALVILCLPLKLSILRTFSASIRPSTLVAGLGFDIIIVPWVFSDVPSSPPPCSTSFGGPVALASTQSTRVLDLLPAPAAKFHFRRRENLKSWLTSSLSPSSLRTRLTR